VSDKWDTFTGPGEVSGVGVRTWRRGPAAWVVLDRPEVLNAIDPPTAIALQTAIIAASEESQVRVIVITGSGERSFSVGADLKWRDAHPKAASRLPVGGGLIMPGPSGIECWKPIIAAVDGYALGGGFELVLASDLAIATEKSVFGLPEVTVGLVADAGGVHRLARQLPSKLAMELTLTGRRLSAHEALELGLINQMVQVDSLISAVDDLIERICAASPLAVQAAKQTAVLGLDRPLGEVMAVRFPLHEVLLASNESNEGTRAFLEHRPPRWSSSPST